MLFGRRRSGLSLSSLLIIVGVLYFTGAGGVILKQAQSLPGMCYGQLNSLNSTAAKVVCGMTSEGVKMVSQMSGVAGRELDGFFGNIGKTISESLDMGAITALISKEIGVPESLMQAVQGFDMGALQGMQSPEAILSQLMQSGPGSIGVGSDPASQLRAAMDSLTIGQRFLSPGSGSYQPSSAVPWLQQGAMQNEYGLMPQLSLGNLFLQGGKGIAPNPLMAAGYYQQALGSLTALQGSTQPGAQQVLGGLPVAPQQMQQEIINIIKTIQPR